MTARGSWTFFVAANSARRGEVALVALDGVLAVPGFEGGSRETPEDGTQRRAPR